MFGFTALKGRAGWTVGISGKQQTPDLSRFTTLKLVYGKMK